VTSKETDLKLGIDENDKLVAVSEEMIRDRIDRFKGYKTLLNKRKDEYQTKVDVCTAELKARKYDMNHRQDESASSGTTGGAEADPQN
jgi:hypothetical protein